MAGVADYSHSHSILLGLVYSQLHGLVSDDLPHAVVTVDYSCGLGLLEYLKVGDRILDACLYTVQIDRLEAVAAMTLYAPAVRFQKDIGTDPGILLRHTITFECIGNKRSDKIPWTNNSAHTSLRNHNIL